jgi:hypothetical protein
LKNCNRFFFLLLSILHLFGCANRVTPTGGIKDVTAPELVTAVPENKSLNFNSKTIVLTFNEYIQLKETAKQLAISPVITPTPVVEIRKKSIVIDLGDSLAPNTTYTINFGNSIADNNEGNVLPGFRYVFSTGSYLDSLHVKGTVVDALTKKPQQGAVAILYNANTPDSLLLNKIPDYFSRTDSNGVYQIFNVRPGSYKLFALTEKNNNYVYDQPDEAVGFAEETFALNDSATKHVGVFLQTALKQSVKASLIIAPGKLLTVFARPVEEVSWNSPNTVFDSVKVEYNTLRDSVLWYCFPAVTDTLSVVWFENKLLVDSVKYQKPRASGNELSTKFTGYVFYPAKGSNLMAETNPNIKWWAPVVQLDSSKIIFQKDSVAKPVKMFFVDSLNTLLSFESEWSEGNFNVVFLPGAVKDIYGYSNDSIKTSFTFPPEKTKGSISFKIMTMESGAHVLQLVNDKDEVIRQRSFEQYISGIFALLDPGKYRLRLVTDINLNSRWDAGNFIRNLSPEPVRYYFETIVVRANWEVEMEWVK